MQISSCSRQPLISRSRRHRRRDDRRRIGIARLRRSRHGRDQISHGVISLVPSSYQRQVRLNGGRPAGRPGRVQASHPVLVGWAVLEVANDGLGPGDRDVDVFERKDLPVFEPAEQVEPRGLDLLLHLVAGGDRDSVPLEGYLTDAAGFNAVAETAWLQPLRQVRRNFSPLGLAVRAHGSHPVMVPLVVLQTAYDGLGAGGRQQGLPLVQLKSLDHLLFHFVASGARDGVP